MASSISSTNEPYSQSATTRPLFEIPDDTKDLDSGNESQNEEGECLIKPEKKPSTTNPFRRVSTHCMHPTVPCPTCKGKGKLSQAQSDTVVALIPMHDNRLQPKRTTLKLAIAFCLLLLIGGLCLAFLFPRRVTLSIQRFKVDKVSIHMHQDIQMNITVTGCVNNTNFFAVEVSNLSAQILFMPTIDRTPHEVGNTQLSSTQNFGIREKRKVNLFVATTFTGKDDDIIEKNCNLLHNTKHEEDYSFPVRVSLTASLKYWSHTEQIQTSTVHYIECDIVRLLSKRRNSSRD